MEIAKRLTPRRSLSASAKRKKATPISAGGHLLIIPNRHVANYFSVTAEERTALWAMVDEGKKILEKRFRPDGYNIGINVGSAAGQTVMHCQTHLIPRRSEDSVNPPGGMRGVIVGKANCSRND